LWKKSRQCKKPILLHVLTPFPKGGKFVFIRQQYILEFLPAPCRYRVYKESRSFYPVTNTPFPWLPLAVELLRHALAFWPWIRIAP
jgi:hypothetical protein